MPRLTDLERVLMERDNLTLSEAREQIAIARELIAEGDDPEQVLLEEFGLEPDHVFDLLLGL